MDASREPLAPSSGRARITRLGEDLRTSLQALLAAFPAGAGGPQALAEAAGTNKVFTSRLQKALRQGSAAGVVYHLPGPEPLRRFVAALEALDVPTPAVAAAAHAVEAFARAIREEAGSRSEWNAMVSAWLPDSHDEFETRRRQAAFKAISELKGVSADLNLGTVLLHPSEDGAHVDVLWVMGLLGLRRLRPGAAVKLATRRQSAGAHERHPEELGGLLRLDAFCQAPPAPLEARHVGETVHYLLGDSGFGVRSAVDLLVAERNLAEMPRYQPRGSGRSNYVFAEAGTPARALIFDIFVHQDLYPGVRPELGVYDTALEGVADPNDPARDLDRLRTSDRIQMLGRDDDGLGIPEMPGYRDMLRKVFAQAGWPRADFDAWRVRCEYPLHGSQVCVSFRGPEARA